MIYYILAAIFIGLGLFMVLMPKQSVKKEDRESEDAIKRARKSGILIIACGVILLVMNIILF